MPKPFGINDDFQFEGIWWVPDQPDVRVAGELAYGQKDGPVLSLTGTFNPDSRGFLSELVDRDVIHGSTKEGKSVSLFRALHTSRQGGLGQPVIHEVYKAHLLAIGYHFANEDEEIFTRSFVSFEDIEEWLGHRFFDLQCASNEMDFNLAINRAGIDRRLADINGMTLSAGSGFFTDRSNTSFTIDARCYIKVKPAQPRSIGWHFSVASKLQSLASLCTGRHLPLTSLSLDGPVLRYSSEHSRPAEVHVYASMTHPESHKSRRFDTPLVYASDLPDPPDAAFQKWFDSYEELSSGLYLFQTALADRAMYINARFSLAIQALEVFHRRAFPGPIIPKSKYSEIRKALVSAIPDGTTKDMREKLQSVLAFSNEPSLKQRLRALIDEVEHAFGERPAGYDETFVKQVVDTRNYYTHYSPELSGKTLEGAAMHYAIRRIVLLLDRKSTRLNSSHTDISRMPSSA